MALAVSLVLSYSSEVRLSEMVTLFHTAEILPLTNQAPVVDVHQSSLAPGGPLQQVLKSVVLNIGKPPSC